MSLAKCRPAPPRIRSARGRNQRRGGEALSFRLPTGTCCRAVSQQRQPGSEGAAIMEDNRTGRALGIAVGRGRDTLLGWTLLRSSHRPGKMGSSST